MAALLLPWAFLTIFENENSPLLHGASPFCTLEVSRNARFLLGWLLSLHLNGGNFLLLHPLLLLLLLLLLFLHSLLCCVAIGVVIHDSHAVRGALGEHSPPALLLLGAARGALGKKLKHFLIAGVPGGGFATPLGFPYL